jgi:hypothetical protein
MRPSLAATVLAPNNQALLADSGASIGKLAFDMELKKAPISADRLMSSLLLSLDQAQARLRVSVDAGARLNFYVDANLAEAKKILLLVHNVKTRFRNLIEAWPEHATLHDVIKACDELLEFQHVEPVAKFLTKAEKLHSSIYEWQIVASRSFPLLTFMMTSPGCSSVGGAWNYPLGLGSLMWKMRSAMRTPDLGGSWPMKSSLRCRFPLRVRKTSASTLNIFWRRLRTSFHNNDRSILSTASDSGGFPRARGFACERRTFYGMHSREFSKFPQLL